MDGFICGFSSARSGINPGLSYGETDPIGYEAIKDKVSNIAKPGTKLVKEVLV